MLKDFINWIQYKIFLQQNKNSLNFSEREIWWCSLGVNLGTEMDGKNTKFNRPVLIIKKFNKSQFWAIPLTTKTQTNDTFYYEIIVQNKQSWLCLSQIRTVDAKRLSGNSKIEKISESEFKKIKNKIMKFLT
jgi:mRNA interferase MazF